MNFNNLYKKYISEAKVSFVDTIKKKYDLDPKTVKHGIGKSNKDGKWYGWTHRGLCGFGIGDKIFDAKYVKKGADMDKMPFVKRGNKTIKNDADAKQAASNFMKYIS